MVARPVPCREVIRYVYGMIMSRRRAGKALALRGRRRFRQSDGELTVEAQLVCWAPVTGWSSRMSAPPAFSLPAGWVAAWTARSFAIDTRV